MSEMLCRKIKQFFSIKPSPRHQIDIPREINLQQCRITNFFPIKRSGSMSSVYRFCSMRLWGLWTRGFLASSLVKRCRRERSVREVFQYFRQTFRPRRTLLITATAAFKNADEDDECDDDTRSISDDELKALLSEVDKIEDLARKTIYCKICSKRLVIEKKLPGNTYCSCKDSKPVPSEDGWEPYMEADDVIIWRQEYKPGQGLYSYKVYGRYAEVSAADFAAIQTDARYRPRWDSAVASLSVVEPRAHGVPDQAVMHWEVLWPRLFANRDYVYIRRHMEFDSITKRAGSTIRLPATSEPETDTQRPSVHSRAKRKAMEECSCVTETKPDKMVDSKVYIIMGRSCKHSDVPEQKHVIRVTEYWSHMVVRTLDRPDEPGMEFVLTYYDEPAVGGLPTGVASWATGRAAPAYLLRMRQAANDYSKYREELKKQDSSESPPAPAREVALVRRTLEAASVSEHDMESSRQGPDIDSNAENVQEKPQVAKEPKTSSKQTQTDDRTSNPSKNNDPGESNDSSRNNGNRQEPSRTNDSNGKNNGPSKKDNGSSGKNGTPSGNNDSKNGKGKNSSEEDASAKNEDGDKLEDDPESNRGGWWRYLYPFYYFM